MLSLLETLYRRCDIDVAMINFAIKTRSTTLPNTEVRANYTRNLQGSFSHIPKSNCSLATFRYP